MSVEELESVLHELLAHLAELRQPQHPYYLSVLGALLHLMTDLETQLVLARAALEQERLIHNDDTPSSRHKTETVSIREDEP